MKELNKGHRCKATSQLITQVPIKDIEDKIIKNAKDEAATDKYTENQKKAMRLVNEYQWALTPKECSDRAKVLQ